MRIKKFRPAKDKVPPQAGQVKDSDATALKAREESARSNVDKSAETKTPYPTFAEFRMAQREHDNAKATDPEPSLLGIPPELRNRIYRYSLTVPGQRIDVNDPRILKGGPGLLAACRQIREEASSIFYTENDFFFEACMLDGTKARKFAERMRKYRKDDKAVLPAEICSHFDFYKNGDQKKLRKWLKAYYHDPILTPGVAQDTPPDKRRDSRTLIVRCFGVVDAMRHKPWAEVAGVLEAFYRCIENLESVREFMDSDSEDNFFETMELVESYGPVRIYRDPRKEITGNDELFAFERIW